MLAWLAWRRSWKAVLACDTVILAVFAVGTVIFGFDQYLQWKEVVSRVSWYGRSLNASLWGLVFRLFSPNRSFSILVDLGPSAGRLALLLCVATVIATWSFLRRMPLFDDQWTLVLSATLLVCPLGWIYYGCLLLPGWRARWPGFLATACWLIPTPWLIAGQPSVVATLFWGSAATWGLLLIWIRALRPS
jgi:hypothetical protein